MTGISYKDLFSYNTCNILLSTGEQSKFVGDYGCVRMIQPSSEVGSIQVVYSINYTFPAYTYTQAFEFYDRKGDVIFKYGSAADMYGYSKFF